MSTLSNPVRWLIDALMGRNSENEYERKLTAEACLRYAPVWYAVSRIAGHVGQLPALIYRRTDKGSEPDISHQAYRLVKCRPNGYQSSFTFRQQQMTHALLYGNGRSVIVRNGTKPVELLPLDPCRSDTIMSDGEKWHLTRLDKPIDAIPTDRAMKSKEWADVWAFRDSDVLHIMGLSLNGYSGLRLSDYASQSLGLGMAGEKQAATQAKKGFHGSLMLEAPPGVFRNEADAMDFLDNFRKRHDGADNTAATGLLREGIKANVVAMNARDLQALESRQFQRQEVALWFLLEHITGDSSATSYNSLTERNLAYLSNCLGRWLKVWEEEIEEKLLTEPQKLRDTHYCRFSTGALLKTDMQTTATTISTLITAMVITPNEARALLDYNKIEGGDELQNPATSSGAAGGDSEDSAETQAEPAEEPADNGDTTAKANRRAMEAMLGNLVGVECNRCVEGTKSGNFLQWMESFYAKWESKLADDIERLGGDRQLASNHCEESKRRLLAVSDTATAETLKQSVADCVESWPSRVNTIIEELELAYVV